VLGSLISAKFGKKYILDLRSAKKKFLAHVRFELCTTDLGQPSAKTFCQSDYIKRWFLCIHLPVGDRSNGEDERNEYVSDEDDPLMWNP